MKMYGGNWKWHHIYLPDLVKKPKYFMFVEKSEVEQKFSFNMPCRAKKILWKAESRWLGHAGIANEKLGQRIYEGKLDDVRIRGDLKIKREIHASGNASGLIGRAL